MLPSGRAAKNKLNQAGGGNYAPASRCVDELHDQLGCTKQEAAAHIARFCRARLVEARCASFWCEVTDRYGANEGESTQVAIPAWFWEHCANGRDAILDWQSGTFAGRGFVDGELHKVRIKGAEFDIAGMIELEGMLRERDSGAVRKPAPPIIAQPDCPPEPVTRGGRPKSENWTNWIAELVSYVHEQGIPNGSGAEGQDTVIAAVEERLEAKGLESLSRSTVQPAVRAALLRLRSAGN